MPTSESRDGNANQSATIQRLKNFHKRLLVDINQSFFSGPAYYKADKTSRGLAFFWYIEQLIAGNCKITDDEIQKIVFGFVTILHQSTRNICNKKDMLLLKRLACVQNTPFLVKLIQYGIRVYKNNNNKSQMCANMICLICGTVSSVLAYESSNITEIFMQNLLMLQKLCLGAKKYKVVVAGISLLKGLGKRMHSVNPPLVGAG